MQGTKDSMLQWHPAFFAGMFQEVDVMCEALQEVLSELMKDQLDEREKKGFSDGFSNGFSDGEQSKLITLIRKKLERGKTISVIADELEETKETILPLYNQVKAELSKN